MDMIFKRYLIEITMVLLYNSKWLCIISMYTLYIHTHVRLSLVPVDFDTLVPSPYRKSFLSQGPLFYTYL